MKSFLIVPALGIFAFAALAQQGIDPIQARLDEVQKLDLSGGRAESEKAASILKSLKREKMDFDQHDTWVRYSRDIAIRLGDLAVLKELSKEESIFPSDLVYTVLLSYGKLTKGDLKGAERLLAPIKEDEINPRDSRRIYALKVRMAALRKDTKSERKYIEKMIEHLPSWPGNHCQSCHDSPKEKDKVTSLPLKSLWFGERYSEILRESGDAPKVKLAAENALKNNPKDDLAKIRLAYAMRALGKTEEGEAVLDSIPYCESPKNELPKARMFFAFP